MATFKQTIEGMKAMEQPETQQPQKPKNTIELNLFGNKPKTQQKLANKVTDEPKNPVKEANVREWVRKNYPTEFQTDDIRGDLTFDDLYKAMQSGEAKDFYKYASEGGKGFDSAVREEIFNGLAQHHGKPYDHFYKLWLDGPEQNQPNAQQPKEGSFDESFEENEYYSIEDYKNAAPNREAAQKLGNAKPTDFSPYVFDTDQGRFTIVNDEQAREDGAKTMQAYFQDEQGFDTFPAEIARDLKAKFGDPSQDEDLEINYQTVADYFIDKYGYSRMLTPHTGKVIDLGNGYKAYQITEK